MPRRFVEERVPDRLPAAIVRPGLILCDLGVALHDEAAVHRRRLRRKSDARRTNRDTNQHGNQQ